MRYFLALLVTLFAFQANAGPPKGLLETMSKSERDVMGRRGYSKTVGLIGIGSASASSESVDWGFTSNYVTVCLEAPATTDIVVYLRLGSTNPATNEIDFIEGAANLVPGRAIPLSGSGDGTDKYCETHPWRTDGLTAFMPLFGSLGTVALDATVDISAH